MAFKACFLGIFFRIFNFNYLRIINYQIGYITKNQGKATRYYFFLNPKTNPILCVAPKDP